MTPVALHTGIAQSADEEESPGANEGARRFNRVPLRHRVLDAIHAVLPHLDSPLLFPAATWRLRRAGQVARARLEAGATGRWRRASAGLRHAPQLRDLEPRCRRLAVRALARMGTSLAMIDQTYGHLAPDAEEQERLLLDAYDSRERTAEGGER